MCVVPRLTIGKAIPFCAGYTGQWSLVVNGGRGAAGLGGLIPSFSPLLVNYRAPLIEGVCGCVRERAQTPNSILLPPFIA